MNFTQLASNINQTALFPDRSKAEIEISPEISTLELSDLVHSLSVLFGEERVAQTKKYQVTVSDLDQDSFNHLSRFNGHNLVLARVKARKLKAVRFNPKPEVRYNEVRIYFSPNFQPKIGPECAARALAKLSQRQKRRFLVTVDVGEEQLTYDNRFGAAYAGARNLHFPEFAQYLCRKHLQVLIDSAQKAVRKGDPLLVQEFGRRLLDQGVEKIVLGTKGKTKRKFEVDLATEINPYFQIAYLEDILACQNRLHKYQMDYNSRDYTS